MLAADGLAYHQVGAIQNYYTSHFVTAGAAGQRPERGAHRITPLRAQRTPQAAHGACA